MPRHSFRLPEGDEQFLEAMGRPWETIAEGGSKWLLIHEYAIPLGYRHKAVSVALLLPPNYPDDQIDMVWFEPHLALTNGRAIAALSSQAIDGKNWQRWSRHRTAQNPWRPGVDDIATHLGLVEDWLAREVARG